jgi:hypothetical protein
VDATLLKLQQDAFIGSVVAAIGPQALFDVLYVASDVDVHQITVGSVIDREFAMPVFENIRALGTNERITPDSQRVKVDRTLYHYGRLAWVDALVPVMLNLKVGAATGPIQSITVETLEAKLGGYASINELRTKLSAMYAPSVVDALFGQLQITTIEDFNRTVHLFVQIVGAPPAPYDPNAPGSDLDVTANLCFKIDETFDLRASLEDAKLTRSILSSDAAHSTPSGLLQNLPYAFVTIFPDGSVTDTTVAGSTASQTKSAVQALFSSEQMFAYFLT